MLLEREIAKLKTEPGNVSLEKKAGREGPLKGSLPVVHEGRPPKAGRQALLYERPLALTSATLGDSLVVSF